MMFYCNRCGAEVEETDHYCARCGAPQRPATETSALAGAQGGISPRTASLLCYIPLVGWLAAVVVLASARFRNDQRVRFHGFQGLYLFIAWLLVDWAVAPFFHFPGGPFFFPRLIPDLLKAAITIAGIVGMVKVAQDEPFRLPVFGELAEKSLAERR